MNLSEFLLARIAEDEAVARAATQGSWIVGDNGEVEVEGGADRWGSPSYVTCDSEGLSASAELVDAEHIARWHPARVLADCDAKRRIGGQYLGTLSAHEKMAGEPIKQLLGEMAVETLGDTLKALAMPYADHSDYDEAWRP